jgi:hypothetical protein
MNKDYKVHAFCFCFSSGSNATAYKQKKNS